MLLLGASLLWLTATSAANVGDYIAAGLGFNPNETSSSLTTVPAPANRTISCWSNATNQLTAYTSTGRNTFEGGSSLTEPSSATENGHSFSGAQNATYTLESSKFQNAHNVSSSTGLAPNVTVTSSLSGDCSQQWEQYWLRGLTSVEASSTLYTSTKTDVDTNYELYMTSWFNSVEPGTTNLATYTRVGANGGHTFTTYVTTETYIRPERTDDDYSINSQSTITTKINTDIFTVTPQTYYTSTWYIDYPRPTCILPSSIDPKCQEQWVSYVAHGTYELGFQSASIVKPKCTSAVVTGTQCSTLVDAYFYRYTMYGPENAPGYVSTNGNSKYWPSTKSFGPGCTLGCQACAITGETVQLYYWPPATASAFINGSGIATQTPSSPNVTHHGPRIANVSGKYQAAIQNRLMILITTPTGTLLTSPTIYVSYDKLYASNSCSGVGKTYLNTIVPITAASDLSSMSMYIGYMHDFYFTTVPFDLNDLVEPIPESIYNKQPRCQASSYAWMLQGMAAQGQNFSCADLGPYAPVIAVPTGVENLDPEWKSCTAFYGGLFDPPKALEPAETADGITTAVVAPSPTTAASPGSAVTDAIPANTNSPVGSTPIAAEPTRALSNSVKEPPQDETTSKPADPTRSRAAVSHQYSEEPTHQSNALTLLAPVQSDAASLEAESGNTVADPLISAIGLLAAASQTTAHSIIADAVQDSQAHHSAVESLAHSHKKLDMPETGPTAGPDITLTDSKGQPIVIAPLLDSDAALISAEGFATTIRAGQVATVGGQLISVAHANPSAVIFDGKTFTMTHATGAAFKAIVTGDAGERIEVKSENDHVVIKAGKSSVGLDPGQATKVDGVSISAPKSGAYVVLNGDKTVSLATPVTSAREASFVTGISAQTIAFSSNGGHLVIADHGNTATLHQGEITTFDGRVVSVEPRGSYAVVDGTRTIKLDSQPTVSGKTATITGTAGQSWTLSKNEIGDLVVADGRSTITLAAAEATIIDGVTISVGASGVVLDGTKTVGLKTASSEISDYTSTVPHIASPTGAEVDEVASKASSMRKFVAGGWFWTLLMLMVSVLLS